MELPSIFKNILLLGKVGDYVKLEKTKNAIVAKLKSGNIKWSKVFYPSTGRIVETRSYKGGF